MNSGRRGTPPKFVVREPQKQQEQESFKKFSASELYCAKCNQAVPVREKMLLFVPGGEIYDYTCPRCGSTVGTRKTNG